MKAIAFLMLVWVAMAAPIAAAVILIKLTTDIPMLQLALAIILVVPTLIASLLGGARVGEKLL